MDMKKVSELRKPEVLPEGDLGKLPPHEREHYIKTTLRKTIALNPNGVTASQLGKNLGFDPRTVDKHLSVMVHTGDIYTVQYDQTTVYLPNGRSIHPILQKEFDVDKDKVIQIFQLRNRLGEFVYFQEKLKSDYREDTNMGFLIPIEKFADFMDYLRSVQTEMMRRR